MAGKVPAEQRALPFVNENAVGSKLVDSSNRYYRCEGLFAAAKANITIESLCQVEEYWVRDYSKKNLGHKTDLVRQYIGAALNTVIDDLKKFLHHHCFEEYAIVFDGSPSFAEAECINIRIVSKKWEIYDFVVCLNLYAKKLCSEELARHIVDNVKKRLELELKNWLVSHQDRANTNKASLDQIETTYRDARPTRSWCCAHTLSNTGKRITESDNGAVFAEMFRKMWQKVVQYAGKGRDYAKSVFKEPVCLSHGVRFFVKFEQICQISRQGPDIIIRDILPYLQNHGWSDKSTNKMLAKFSGDKNLGNLGMAVLECNVVAIGGKSYAEGCYILEGDSCIILRAESVFQRIEKNIKDDEDIDMNKLKDAVELAVDLISKGRNYFSKKKEEATAKSDESLRALNEEKSKLNDLKNRRKEMTNRTSSRGRQIRNTDAHNTPMMDAIEDISGKIGEQNTKIRSISKPNHDKLACESKEASDEYNNYMAQFPHQTCEALVQYSKAILKQAKEYYVKLFKTEGGDCYDIRQMASVAQMFNPLYIKDMTEADVIVNLYELADKLKHFKYRHFNATFIRRLKLEMLSVVAEARNFHDLDKYKPSDKFKTRMAKRVKRKDLDSDHGLTWKDDDAEYACRIWEWWKPRVNKFPSYSLALRLVVLTQLSSCSVERVFSRLQLIRDVCGDNMKEDMTEFRVFLQCNGDIGELLAKQDN